MKRVYALYRVSTSKQVDINQDDIPMQKLACREFSDRQGWTLIKEFEEKGISGFKVSAEDRDAIQDLKEAALNNEFDVLLVFMFDRLGRIENETPFVLQWFTEHGIEVWSVNEGQQKFEHHVDKLLNYIRFWQASGESEKTSVRVKTRLSQMTEEGLYTGGTVPFGYQLVDNGRLNKKGQPMKDLAKEPIESELVYQMYRWVANEGYGSYQIAEMLNKEGYRTHSGVRFQSVHVLRILRNLLNIGVLRNGASRSEAIERLRIVPDDLFETTQKILAERSRKFEDKRSVSISNRGTALLGGNFYCGHCGCRMTTNQYVERKYSKNGEMRVEHNRYVCYHRARNLNECDGACSYKADKIDEAMLSLMHNLFTGLKGNPDTQRIEKAHKQAMENNHRTQKVIQEEIEKLNKQIGVLRDEIGLSLLGESKISLEHLNAALEQTTQKLKDHDEKLEKLREEETQAKITASGIVPAYNRLKGWAEEFDGCNLKQKKMIASQLFTRVEVRKGYYIHVELNITYKQFLEEWTGNSIDLSA